MSILFLTLYLFSSVCQAISIEPSSSLIEDTANFTEAFNESNARNYETIHVEPGEYFINKSMPVLMNTVTITSRGIARIHLINVDRFITISGIDSTIENLTISGDGTRVSNAILIQNTSHTKLDGLVMSGLNVALELKYSQDTKSFNALGFSNNDTDFLVTQYQPGKNESSSFHFTNSVMLHSERAVVIDTAIANFSFDNHIFAPWSKTETHPVSFHRPAFQGSITNSRFEARGFNFPVDNLYINGASLTYPGQGISIERNYFSGINIANNINFGKFSMNNYVEKTLFKSSPLICDIKLGKNFQSKNHTLVNLKRKLKVCINQ